MRKKKNCYFKSFRGLFSLVYQSVIIIPLLESTLDNGKEDNISREAFHKGLLIETIPTELPSASLSRTH